MTTLAYFWSYLDFLFEFDFASALTPIPFALFYFYLEGRDDMLHTSMITLALLLLELSPHLVFEFDFVSAL